MQRYHATSCSSAVNNAAIGGSTRDSRSESSSIPPNFSLNSRRPLPLTPYKLRCDREPLNSRLGPPDFHLQTSSCPEETLTEDYVQNGYRETVKGLEEAREISLSQIHTFTKPVILKCKESIRKCHRSINESRAQKRKAGQVYGVPLSGSLLTKPGVFPEQRPCGEESRKKWIEGLSQPHKRLCFLADHVPHGYRRKSLLEVLIRNNVPLLRATWFVKVTYLNQVRPSSSNLSSGVPDKTQFSRSEQWTKDVIDYLHVLLDEFVSKNNFHSTMHIRDRSPQLAYPGSLQHRSDAASTSTDADDPSLHFKWWYAVRLLQWHHAEGLIVPSLIIDWVFNQLQEKDSLGILQLLLPVIYGVIEAVVLCQTYVRTLVGIAIRFIQEPSPGGSDLVDNSRRAYTMSALVEMLRYLIIAVPDTFVALDCFPLPLCLVTHGDNDGSFLLKLAEDDSNTKTGPIEVACLQRDKSAEVHPDSYAIGRIVTSIEKRAENLARAARPGHPGQNIAKALLALDKSLVHGDVRGAYTLLFENLCDGAVDERWIAEVSSCLRSSLNYIGAVTLSFISSVFFICEWATCDFRDFRTGAPSGLKFTGRKDFSQIYIAIRILQLKRREMQSLSQCKNESSLDIDSLAKDPDLLNKHPGRFSVGSACEFKYSLKRGKNRKLSNIFESPSPLHDIIVCWIDQHEIQNGEGVKRLQLLIMELVRVGIFYPHAYVRQLIVSGIMDRNGVSVDLERRKRHYRILKQLPGSYVCDALEEAQVLEGPMLLEVMNIYSNERRLVLHGLLDRDKSSGSSWQKQKHYRNPGGGSASPSSIDQWRSFQGLSSFTAKNVGQAVDLEDLKASIVALLQLPSSSLSSDTGPEDFVGVSKRSVGSSINKMDIGEGTPGCEECRRVKRQKLGEDMNSYLSGFSASALDDEDIWWQRRGSKSLDKMDPPPKQAKQSGRGRQKGVRKTQSLAQLAAARIEGSQGASTSHVCDSRVNCPHHRSSVEGDTPKYVDGIRMPYSCDIVSIGEVLKKMRLVEKRSVMVWLIGIVKHLVEEAEKNAAKVGQYGRPYSTVDDGNSVRWKLGEDELSMILYLMDVSNELVSAAKFLLWLLPKVLSSPAASIHGGRNILMLSRNAENIVCEVGETFLVSSIRRYENIIVAADLVPETLKAVMHRVAATMASTGRVSGSSALVYARNLLKKYGNVASVVDWEKNLKSSYDKRLISELESGRLPDGEFGFPLGVPAGVEDLDDFFRQKISVVRGGSRVALTMNNIVQRQVDEVSHYFYGKERKIFGAGTVKSPGLEKLDDVYQIAQQIVMGLMDCMRQTGGAAQEGDPTLVSSAISAIVGNVGQVIAKIPDLTAGNHLNFQSTSSSMHFARRILRIHITCLCLLKDALGERQSRVFEVALAAEASSALTQLSVAGKASRAQFHASPESHDSSSNSSYESLNSSVKSVLGRGAKITGAVSALLVGALLQGVTSLERMVSLFRLREGLDLIHFFRSLKSNSNGSARSFGTQKLDNLVEVSTHWFRVLVGNCRTVSDGFIVELLGEASIVALSRMQRTLPLNLVFPPAYSIFAFVIWKGLIFSTSVGLRDDVQQLYQSLALGIGDALKHHPFRDVCLRDTRGLYDLIAADAVDYEFTALLESSGADMLSKCTAFVPLRARLFLDALIECEMPQPMPKPEDGNRMHGQGDSKTYYKEKEAKLRDKLVHVLDTLQPAKFHWQWVELRLLLNEQTVVYKLDNNATLVEAIKSVSPNADKVAVSEKDSSFVELVLIRLLARPDAASLFSEVVHLFGRSLEDQMLMQTKWLLGGNDVLYGRKSIRQRLINIAETKHLSTKLQFWKPWGWCHSNSDIVKTRGNKRKFEVTSLEEGEVVDEGSDMRCPGKGSFQVVDVEGFIVRQQHVTERAFVELVLPCVDQGSDDSRNTFASDMIKQMNNIEQQINALSRGATKSVGSAASGIESPASKGNSRKGMRGGSPGLAKRPAGPADGVPPSPGALRASMSLRLQFLLRLLPIMCTDGEPTGRNMRHTLASVILRLLGSRVVHEDAGHTISSIFNLSKRDIESLTEASAASVFLSGESLFDRLLLLLHGLLSSYRPSWLKLKSGSKSTSECGKDFSVFDREMAENLQNDLDRMHMPDHIRWRIQTAMPILPPPIRCSVSCQPPSVSSASLAALQSSNQIPVLQPNNSILPQRNSVSLVRIVTNVAGKAKQLPLQDPDLEIDPWILLEDGAGVQSSSNSAATGGSDHANLRASNWFKGAIRVRRTDLTYIGAVDEDS